MTANFTWVQGPTAEPLNGPMAEPLTLHVIARRAETMIPTLRARAEEAEALRRLPEATMTELRSSGVARVLQPAMFGGAQAALSGMLDVLIPVGAGCGSTAWCLAQYIMHNYMIARWPMAAQHRIWRERPDCLVSGIVIPLLGTARPVADGYIINGNWPFVSGVIGSDWCVLAAMVDGGSPKLDIERYFIVPTMPIRLSPTPTTCGVLPLPRV